MKTLLTLLLVAALAAGCASTPKRSQGDRILARYEPYIGEPIRSFTAFRQESWQPINRTQFILTTGFNHAYLITIAGSCPDLMFSNAIRVTSSGSSISTFDQVLVRSDRCPINVIQPIDLRRMRADREELRRDQEELAREKRR